MQRENFRSRLGFLLVSAGCAIGIGNVWRFPYITGQYGGGYFVLFYLICLVIMGIPVMTMELAVGRASRKSAVQAYQTLEKPGQKWHIHGYLTLVGCYLLMMFYTTVAGWMLHYFYMTAAGKLAGLDANQVAGKFTEMLADPGVMTFWMVFVVALGVFVCAKGLQNGLERVTKVMMIALLALIVVLAVHSLLLPGAAEFIATAKEKGRQVLFFTNNTSRSPMEYVERLSRMGIPVTREDILTAGDVTIHYLQTHCAGQSVYLLGVPALRQSFAEAGISLTEEQPDLVVVGFDKTLTYERLEKACIYLRRGAHFLATHPDINCPTEAEPIPDCGAICQAITASTGFMPHSLGKPAAETVELVEAVSGLPREAIAFVGDRLYTDVACGTQNGACGILVMTGETTPEMLAESSFSPDAVFPSLGAMAPLL